MSNQIELRGVISNVTLRETSLFMTVREDTRGGTHHATQHTVKAYYPKGSPETAEMWASRLQHLERGMMVHVRGKQSFEKEQRLDPESQTYVPVRHPFQDRDLYSPFIWAIQIDAIFDPALHMKRAQQQAHRAPDQATPPPPSARQPARQASAAGGDEELPPLPTSDIPWN